METRKSLIWSTPSITCLGDRLLDTMLLSTYAKFLNADLYFPWLDCPFTIGQSDPKYAYKEGEHKSWEQFRFEDYRFENYTQYFNLPKNVRINQHTDTPTNYFTDGLGGVISPWLFYQKYMTKICSYEDFDKSFKETMSEFTPTDKLLNLVQGKIKPNVSVHLRRTDKINVKGDYNSFMTFNGLDDLNNRTVNAINKIYSDDKQFYFSSEDKIEKSKYENLYPNHINHDFECSDIEKTYIDLYTLSISDYIILSQIHSNFSVFASYINNAKLIYLYDNTLIETQGFNHSDNFINYKNI